MDISRSEQVETDLDRLIERRHERRVLSEGERVELEAWQVTEHLEEARKREENRVAWCAYFRRLAGALYTRADEYIARAERLEANGHENATKGDAA